MGRVESGPLGLFGFLLDSDPSNSYVLSSAIMSCSCFHGVSLYIVNVSEWLVPYGWMDGQVIVIPGRKLKRDSERNPRALP